MVEKDERERIGREVYATSLSVLTQSRSRYDKLSKYWDAEQLIETTIAKCATYELHQDMYFFVWTHTRKFLRLISQGILEPWEVDNQMVLDQLNRLHYMLKKAGRGEHLRPVDRQTLTAYFSYLAECGQCMAADAGKVEEIRQEACLLRERVSHGRRKDETSLPTFMGKPVILMRRGEVEFGLVAV